MLKYVEEDSAKWISKAPQQWCCPQLPGLLHVIPSPHENTHSLILPFFVDLQKSPSQGIVSGLSAPCSLQNSSMIQICMSLCLFGQLRNYSVCLSSILVTLVTHCQSSMTQTLLSQKWLACLTHWTLPHWWRICLICTTFVHPSDPNLSPSL